MKAEEFVMDYESVTAMPHALGLAHVDNDRQLGGYVNKEGRKIRMDRLLRTANLHNLQDDDIALLTDKYHVKTIIDFRTRLEAAAKPDVSIPGTDYVWISVNPEVSEDKNPVVHANDDELSMVMEMVKMPFDLYGFYIEIIKTFRAQQGYRKFFDYLLSNPDGCSVLWHCNAGKDRTGIAAVFLMSVLDFDRETMMEDYLLTNEYRADRIESMLEKARELTDDERIMTGIRCMFGVMPETMEQMMNWCDREYGSVKGFVQKKINLSDDEIDRLKAMYLE